jgi:hypothetical protein
MRANQSCLEVRGAFFLLEVATARAGATGGPCARGHVQKTKTGVMRHPAIPQPLRVKGAASRLLHNWVGAFRAATLLGHKQYKLQHIDRGNTVTQSRSTI